MKISILLPYKENFSPLYPGAVSLFINSMNKLSNFRNKITVFGSTDLKEIFSSNKSFVLGYFISFKITFIDKS